MNRFKRQSLVPVAKSWLSAAVPAVLSFLIATISFSPSSFRTRPQLAVIPVFFYAFRADARFGAVMAMALGWMEDYVSGAPLGANALLFPVLYLAIRYQKFFSVGDSFRFSWMAFCIAAFALVFAKYALGFYFLPGMAPGRSFMAWLLLAASYPAVYYVLKVLSGKGEGDA
ncbi:MAG: rod shape-determining protein MreD [Rickettsiales bacterium]|jgi:rod shape-determining protein MreD|nr:rod shape-determining protein MreD [Rickettsiales bacterium]